MTDIEWDRVEPHTRLEELEEGLQARVADPLWMLARQWQLGEFRGEDAASPVHARVRVESVQINSFRNEAVANSQAQRRRGIPLEAWVEAERVTDGPAAIQLAVEAGLQFLRRVDAAGLGSLRVALRQRFALRIDASVSTGLPDRELRRLELLARRALDGRALANASAADLRELALPREQARALRQLHEAWKRELDERFVEPPSDHDAWADERLEYSFSVAAQLEVGDEVLLRAAEYPGGHLDWYAFDRDQGTLPPHDLEPSKRRVDEYNLLPVPLAYAGMPASRWWEFEEGAVYFGGIEAGPADIGRLVVAEFATIYSDDWFLLPVRAELGTIVRVKRVEVIDTFGESHVAKSAAVLDQASLAAGQQRAWSFWETTGDPSAAAGKTPWLLLAPVVVSSLDGDPVEEVAFVRDEAANLAWAIETKIEGPLGTDLRRRLLWSLAQGGSDDGLDELDESEDAWRYRLQSSVPPWWIPLVPERIAADSAEMRLRRARMLAWEDLDTRFVGAHGQILAPTRPLRLHEEEIPRGGVEVTRAWQLARNWAGEVHLWMARRKRPGRGERGSGLRFDTIIRR
jgi:hypothetical protein